MEILVGVGLLALVLLAIVIAIWLFAALVVGAFRTFAYAAESGFVGVALYVILWVIASPLMVVACIILGALSIRE